MKTMLKGVLYLGIVAGGAFLAVNNIPSLKANILEVVNPRVQERALVQKLESTLEKVADATTDEAREALIVESQELVQEIAEINEEHSGVVDGIISTVAETMLKNTPSPTVSVSASTGTLTPSPCVAP